jgi:hypothetical protein
MIARRGTLRVSRHRSGQRRPRRREGTARRPPRAARAHRRARSRDLFALGWEGAYHPLRDDAQLQVAIGRLRRMIEDDSSHPTPSSPSRERGMRSASIRPGDCTRPPPFCTRRRDGVPPPFAMSSLRLLLRGRLCRVGRRVTTSWAQRPCGDTGLHRRRPRRPRLPHRARLPRRLRFPRRPRPRPRRGFRCKLTTTACP